jgi:putative FmdB family regulatory protein
LPLYEYQCLKCGKRIEKIQKFSDRPLAKCEYCGGKLQRLLSSPAIQFKGSGWYVTDYARKPASPESGKGAGSSDGDQKKSSESAQKPEPSLTSQKSKVKSPNQS